MNPKYKTIVAVIDCGSLSWRYILEDSSVTGRMSHDEDVTDWTEDEVRNVTAMTLDCADLRELIEIEYA